MIDLGLDGIHVINLARAFHRQFEPPTAICKEGHYVWLSLIFFFQKIFLIGVQLFYNVVLVSTVQRSESAICIHISPLFWISFPFKSSQNIEQSSLCYTVGSHQLSVLYIVVDICQSQSLNSSHSPPCPLGNHKFVFYICDSISALQISSSVHFFQIPHISDII